MKIATFLIAACAMMTATLAYSVDVTAAFSACAITDNDKLRLACYDKIRDGFVAEYKRPQTAASGYREISLIDLKTDIKEMTGKRVVVKASIQTMGELSMLKSDAMDMAPLWAEIEKLPREDRKKLAGGCQLVLCSGQFSGVVHKGAMGPSLSLDKVVWQ